ncbi:hypothetical protein Bbelb_002550 [Branchiostoma belcheri]|nr:hypothetical protein Bbelb_002550 [Branchiostoma belcheri]
MNASVTDLSMGHNALESTTPSGRPSGLTPLTAVQLPGTFSDDGMPAVMGAQMPTIDRYITIGWGSPADQYHTPMTIDGLCSVLKDRVTVSLARLHISTPGEK